MQLGMIGLGRMGANIVRRATKDGHEAVVYDHNPDAVKAMAGEERTTGVSSLSELKEKLAAPRVVWVMVPAGEITGHTIEELAGQQVSVTGVDGCGAPLMSISLAGLARAFSALVRAEPGTAERKVADAMREHPAWMSGTTRYDAAFMEAVPGLLMKPGADGVCAFAFADGVACAVKIDDGGQRALPPVLATLLTRLLGDREADLEALGRMTATPVTGGGEPVGEVRAAPFVLAG